MLFCLTEYTAQALNAMRDKPNANRRDAVNQVLDAAGRPGHRIVWHGRQWSWCVG